MEKCVHVSKIRPAWDHSILNPVKWLCFTCRTTESVWACLSCSNVACGRFNEQHALKHFQDSKHPISIEVNDKYVYCYVCDDYVLNDNAAGDIKLLRSALSAIAAQKFTDIESRGRRLLRSYSHTGVIKRDHADDDDKVATADWHQRQRLLGKVFGAWRTYIRNVRRNKEKTSIKEKKRKSEAYERTAVKKPTITPGVTGLRNLGNTCYMNSVLQVLSHIDAFRDFFLSLKDLDSSPSLSPQTSSSLKSSSSTAGMTSSPTKAVDSPVSKLVSKLSPLKTSPKKSAANNQLLLRQTTLDCFQHLMSTRSQTKNGKLQQKGGGLNGGSSQSSTKRGLHLICEVEAKGTDDKNVSLCSELHGLNRVLWSGKWAQVSPHAFLQAVWQAIPMFKGYFQHDAQEFLCELLDKVQRELDCVPRPLRREDAQLVTELFQGELVSQVICLRCKSVSQTNELFLDLSLEFPDRYQITKQNSRIAQDVCHLTEMLAKFTDVEYLEGQIYACEKCNSKIGKNKEKIYTEARKQLLIHKLPQILRLHLKRFRWSGRFHREKISTHVAVDENLNLEPFCSEATEPTSHEYQLFAVIIHHGKGFGSGHYTAYTWNSEAESWINCNDSRMILSSIEEVLKSQAYILFYRAVTDKLPLLTKFSSSLLSLSSNQSLESGPPSLISEDTLSYDMKIEDSSPTIGDSVIKTDDVDYASRKEDRVPYAIKSDDTVIINKAQGDGRSNHKMKLRSSDVSLNCDSNCNDVTNMKDHITKSNSQSSISFVPIDCEISFKESVHSNITKKRKSELVDMKLNQTDLKRTVKHSLDSSEPLVKKKKISFSTDMFYSKEDSKPQVISTMKGSQIQSSLKKLDKYLHEPAKIVPKSPPHVKRRKSTFW